MLGDTAVVARSRCTPGTDRSGHTVSMVTEEQVTHQLRQRLTEGLFLLASREQRVRSLHGEGIVASLEQIQWCLSRSCDGRWPSEHQVWMISGATNINSHCRTAKSDGFSTIVVTRSRAFMGANARDEPTIF